MTSPVRVRKGPIRKGYPIGEDHEKHKQNNESINAMNSTTSPIKIGVITDITGPLSLLGVANANIAKLAIDEMNAHGGLLGRPLLLHLEDSATTDIVAGAKARKLIQEDRVDALLGGIYSSTRQAIKGPVVEGKKLYIYPEQYEGQECHPLIFCTGPVPAQQVESMVPWLMEKTGAKKFYCPSADYIWPHILNKKLREVVAAHGGSIVGEEYFPMDHTDYAATVQKIASSRAEVVFNTIVPPGVGPFLEQLHKSGFTKRGGQLVCTYFEENLLSLFPPEQVDGMYSCLDYYQSVNDPFSDLLGRYDKLYPGSSKFTGGQRGDGFVSRIETMGGRGEGSRIARSGRRNPRTRPREDRAGTGRTGRDGARSASPSVEHVHRPCKQRQVRGRKGPWHHRSEGVYARPAIKPVRSESVGTSTVLGEEPRHCRSV
jgi:ABC-type branched-subunit amino acid transport system substrate-binding protein